MLSVIKEIGIFIVIAQAILYFVPGDTYVKYVKILIGIMMIAKMISSVFSLLSENGIEEIILQGEALLRELENTGEECVESSMYGEIYIEIGKEIENKLNQNPAEGYDVEQVKVMQEGDDHEILLYVTRQMGVMEKGQLSEKELEVYYANILQSENVKVQMIGN